MQAGKNSSNAFSTTGETTFPSWICEESCSEQDVARSDDPMMMYEKWLPAAGTRAARGRTRQARPCRACSMVSVNCYKSDGNEKCDHCILMKSACRPDLRGAVPLKYRQDRDYVSGRIEQVVPSQVAEESSSEPDLEEFNDPLVVYRKWLPTKLGRRDEFLRALPCRGCFTGGRKCLQSLDSVKCDRCSTTNMRCRQDLDGAVLRRYAQHIRKQQAQLQQYDMQSTTEAAAQPGEQADYLSIASGSEDEPVEHTIADRDWSSASEEDIDADEIGLKVLAMYQEDPTRAQDGGVGEHTPCRRCLLNRLCCQKPNGPGSACKLCQGRIDVGRQQHCSSDLRGVVPYQSRYSVNTVPGHQSSERVPPTYAKSKRFVQEPTVSEQPHRASVSGMKITYWESDSDTSSAVVAREALSESGKSTLARMFGGNANDTGWRLLQIYMSRSRMDQMKKCRACSGLCSRNLRGSLAFKHNFYSGGMVPPQLAMDNTIIRRYDTTWRTRAGSSLDDEDDDDGDDGNEERVVDLEDNYFGMEESDRDDDEGNEGVEYINEETECIRPTTNEEILDRMFDGDANDKGWRLLQIYMARRSDRHIASGAERIPCRFCLKKGLNCHRLKGPKQSCKSCRGTCPRDLRGALAFKHNTYKDTAAPDLGMNNLHRRWLGKALEQGPASSTDDDDGEDEEQITDFGDNYLEITDSDEEEMGSIEGTNYGDGDMEPASRTTNDEILASMFDDGPEDVVYQTLMWYLSRKRRPNLDGAVQIPCRRCLRANLRCHQYNGPDERCRQCAKPRIRGCCDKDLRGGRAVQWCFQGVKAVRKEKVAIIVNE